MLEIREVQPRRNIKGWLVYGSGSEWAAYRFGVRMRANSESLIVDMILRRCDKFSQIPCQCADCRGTL